MYGACGSVSLDNYWNSIATPFLFIILGFGLFVLFGLNDIQFLGSESVLGIAGKIASMKSSKSSSGDAEYDFEDQRSTVAEHAASVGEMYQDTGKGAIAAKTTNAMVKARSNASLKAGAASNAAAKAQAGYLIMNKPKGQGE